MIRSRKSFAYISLILVLALMFSLGAGYFVGISFTSDTVADAADYYASLDESLTGEAFRQELESLITTTHKKQTSYDDLKTVFKTSDADPNNSGNIIWFYSGKSVSYSGFGSGFGSTNREHVWPKHGGAAFSEKSGPGSDAHHLRPAEAGLNTNRGTLDFGYVEPTAGNISQQAGSSNYDNLCYDNGTYFYPGEGYRGATARILMYVHTRWGDANGLSFVDGTGSNKTIGKISDLLKWHYQEPPTQEEIRRNEVVYGIQGNRNPFIDHPEYATKIYCYDGRSYNNTLLDIADQYDNYGDSNVEVESITLSPSTSTLTIGQTQQLNATFYPAGSSTTLSWSSSDSSVATVDANGNVTAKAGGNVTITAVSQQNSKIVARATITVKTALNIEISGTLEKSVYYEGDSFDPTGLIVTVTYNDNSTEIVANSNCKWFDSTTRANTLSKGTTSVLCIVGNIEQSINGIIVKAAVGGKIEFTRSNFTNSGSYGWHTWSTNGISGQAWIFGGNKTELQMNSSQNKCYIYNTTAIPGKITSITITIRDGTTKKWGIRTSPTPYDDSASKYPTTGTSQNEKTVSTTATWTISGDDKFFTINYLDSGVAYIESIVITYGGGEACEHNFGTLNEEVPATCSKEGTIAHYNCSNCGGYFDTDKNEVSSLSIPKIDHTYGTLIAGTPATCLSEGEKAHYTCATCSKHFDESKNELTSLIIPIGDHDYGTLIAEVPSTCVATGVKAHYTCSICDKDFDENKDELDSLVIALGAHKYGEWIEVVAPTTTTTGVKAHYTCATCSKHFDENGNEILDLTIPVLEDNGCDHNYGTLIPEEPATCLSLGIKAHYTCNKCGVNFDENKEIIFSIVISKTDHNYSAWIAQVPATCSSTGVKGHYECQDCHKTFDADKSELTSLTISKGEHTYSTWIEEVPATVLADGVKGHYDCTECNKHFDEDKNELSSLTISKLQANTAAFEEAMRDVSNAEGHENIYNAICVAIEEYNKLSADEKTLVAEDYALLLEAVEVYNTYSSECNDEMTDAISVALSCIGGIASVLVALLVALKRFI